MFMMKLDQERFSLSDFVIDKLNGPGPANDFQTLLSLDQPVFLRKPQVGFYMAKQEYSAKKEDCKRKREEIAVKAAPAYLAVEEARKNVELSELSLVTVEEGKRLLGIVKAGTLAYGHVDVPAMGRRFTGGISGVVPAVNAGSRTSLVKIDLNDPSLKPGLYGEVPMPGGGKREAVLVPKGAVVEKG